MCTNIRSRSQHFCCGFILSLMKLLFLDDDLYTTYYISPNGSDKSTCGDTADTACRTLEYVSQRMTFLYSPRLGNRSSRPVTKLTAMISKAWRPCRMSNLDRMIAPLWMRVDTVPYPRACVVRPSEMTLYKEAYWPQAVSQSLAASQS